MALIVKPDISKIWAETGSTAAPPDAKISSGWGYEMMPFEWENFLQNRTDLMLNHINQRGIPEWDAATEYQADRSYVTGSAGVVYRAVTTNTGINPNTDGGTNWVRAFAGATGGGATGTWGINISGSAALCLLKAGDTMTGSLTVNRSQNDGTSKQHLAFTRGDGSGAIFTLNSENTGNDDVSALTVLSGPQGSGVERFRITSSGNVGVGTASPGAKLDVIGDLYVGATGVANKVQFRRPADSVTGTYVGFHTTSNSDFGLYNSSGGGNLRLATNSGYISFESALGTERMRINSSGNVGIGAVPSGSVKLEVNGGIGLSNGTGLVITQTTTSGHGLLKVLNSSGAVQFRADASSGVVGIGTDSPNFPITINNSTAQIQFVNSSTSTTATDGFRVGLGGGASLDAYVNQLENANLIFNTNGTERFRIDNTGNVGVGTSAPSDRLHIAGATVRIDTSKTPASATAPGSAGQICWDTNYVYVCVATNTWKRAALSTW